MDARLFFPGLAIALIAAVSPSAATPTSPPAKPSPRASLPDLGGADAAFSARARRRAAIFLRIRLDEMRLAELERARAAIHRTLSVDDLIAYPSPAPASAPPVATKR